MKYIKGFDGIRALSILLVISAHAGLTEMLPETSFFKERLGVLISGRAGVDIFFCLSGFLITRLLLIEYSNKNKIEYKKFYARRFLRLLPPLLIFYSVIAILMASGIIYRTFTALLLSFFYLYNYAPHIYYTTELGHTWSLGVEEQFYLLWPLLISIFYRSRLLLICVIIILLCYFLPYLVNDITINYHGKPSLLREHYRVNRFFIPAAYPIITGCLISAVIFYYDQWGRKFLAKGFILFAAIILFTFPLYCPEDWISVAFKINTWGITLFLAWLFYNPVSLTAKILEVKPIAYLGRISYGLYVYQGLFLRTGPTPDALFIQQFPQNVIFSFVAAILSYELVEKYFLKMKTRFR